jgi:hypothetical protein
MTAHIWGIALCLSTIAPVITGCSECSDCERGPNPVAYARVRTATSTGPLGGVAVRLERQAFVPLTAATDVLGEHMFEVLNASIDEAAAVIVTPPAGYTAPAPQVLSLFPGDTVEVQVLLGAAP